MGSWSSRGPSDASLISESIERPERFAAIFDRHFDAIRAYLVRRVGAHHADDLAAQTFVVAFERRASFRETADSARPWLFGIATNLMRNEWRSEQRALSALARLAPERSVTTEGDGAPGRERLATALQELDRGQRDALLLYVWEDLSYEEISSALGIPVGTVRSRIFRARARLSSALTAVPEKPEQQEMVE
jgi:RNA polymerase sigma factor (sigma-70 family)